MLTADLWIAEPASHDKMVENEDSTMGGLIQNTASERQVIEYDFYKEFQYKDIVLFLRQYHSVHLSERTLKRKLKP